MCNYKRVVSVRITETNMVTIGVDQSLSNSAMYEHICPENIQKLYKYSGICGGQQHYKTIIESAIVLGSRWNQYPPGKYLTTYGCYRNCS